MSDEEYIEFRVERARKEAERFLKYELSSFDEFKQELYPRTKKDAERFVELLKEMGDDNVQVNDLNAPAYDDDEE